MTYDNETDVNDLAVKCGFGMPTIAMTGTHHPETKELLIGKI